MVSSRQDEVSRRNFEAYIGSKYKVDTGNESLSANHALPKVKRVTHLGHKGNEEKAAAIGICHSISDIPLLKAATDKHTNHIVNPIKYSSKTMRLLLEVVGNFTGKCRDWNRGILEKRRAGNRFLENPIFPRCSHAMRRYYERSDELDWTNQWALTQ